MKSTARQLPTFGHERMNRQIQLAHNPGCRPPVVIKRFPGAPRVMKEAHLDECYGEGVVIDPPGESDLLTADAIPVLVSGGSTWSLIRCEGERGLFRARKRKLCFRSSQMSLLGRALRAVELDVGWFFGKPLPLCMKSSGRSSR